MSWQSEVATEKPCDAPATDLSSACDAGKRVNCCPVGPTDFCDLGCMQGSELANSGPVSTCRDDVHRCGPGSERNDARKEMLKLKQNNVCVVRLQCVENIDTAYRENEKCPFRNVFESRW